MHRRPKAPKPYQYGKFPTKGLKSRLGFENLAFKKNPVHSLVTVQSLYCSDCTTGRSFVRLKKIPPNKTGIEASRGQELLKMAPYSRSSFFGTIQTLCRGVAGVADAQNCGLPSARTQVSSLDGSHCRKTRAR